jgi:dCTP diphosphatase
MTESDLAMLRRRLQEFADARDWGSHHTPKNPVMALASEVGELVAEFQWLTPEEAATVMDDPQAAQQVRDEMADVLAYLLHLANALDVDLAQAFLDKMNRNEKRLPAGSTATEPVTRRIPCHRSRTLSCSCVAWIPSPPATGTLTFFRCRQAGRASK